MFTLRIILLFILLVLGTNGLIAQGDLSPCWKINYSMYPRVIEVGGSLNPGNMQETTPSKRLPKLTTLTGQNITFNKRIWSQIQLKEKVNQHLYYPLKAKPNLWSMWNVIRFGLEVEQSLTAYTLGIEQDDSFKFPLHPIDSTYCNHLKNLLYRTEFVDSLDENGEPIYDELFDENVQTTHLVPIVASDIIKYYIKEDWYFDMERSIMEKRIIGIAPVIEQYDDFGDVKGFKTLFWLYSPECELMFQNHIAYVRDIDQRKFSYTDILRKRMFTSTIIKESSASNARLNATLSGQDALLESERIRKKFDTMEHDLWSY
ncbi:MAG: gliding motility protein GldN [Flavobacteriales bacterium]|nr:gliding motility protein GldN [Flavobacteriales bacterium]